MARHRLREGAVENLCQPRHSVLRAPHGRLCNAWLMSTKKSTLLAEVFLKSFCFILAHHATSIKSRTHSTRGTPLREMFLFVAHGLWSRGTFKVSRILLVWLSQLAKFWPVNSLGSRALADDRQPMGGGGAKRADPGKASLVLDL